MKAEVQISKNENYVTVVLEDRLRDQIFGKITRILQKPSSSNVTTCNNISSFVLEKVEEFAPETIANAGIDKEYFPTFFGDRYDPWFYWISYRLQLKEGDLCAKVQPFKDLGEFLRIEDLRAKSGFVITNGHYVPNEKIIVQTHAHLSSGHIIALNLLCKGRTLDREIIEKYAQKYLLSMPAYTPKYDSPLSSISYPKGFNSQGGELYSGCVIASLNSSLIKEAKEAEKPISKFMKWTREHKTEVEDIGEIIMLLLQNNRKLRQLSLNHSASRSLQSFDEALLDEAISLYSKLHPPKNNRMQYLST